MGGVEDATIPPTTPTTTQYGDSVTSVLEPLRPVRRPPAGAWVAGGRGGCATREARRGVLAEDPARCATGGGGGGAMAWRRT